MPSGPTYHEEDWRRNLRRGQAGAAFFRRWFVDHVTASLGGRGILIFPAGMTWCGTTSARYRQIGNAVPPLLAYAVALAMGRALGLGSSVAPQQIAA